MRRAIHVLLGLALLGAGTSSHLPARAADAAPAEVGAPDELATTRDRLGGAARELSAIEAELRRTNDEVAALDIELATASTALAEVQDELAVARVAAAAARDAERDAAADLAAADAGLDASLTEWNANRDQLAARAVHAFKHGGGTPQDVLVRGVTGASDFHDVAVTLETVGRLTARDRELVDDSVAFTRDAAGRRAEVAALRATSVAAIRIAVEEAARVQALVDRQGRVVDEVTDTRRRRTAVLAELEADAVARAVLVRDLEQRVAALEVTAQRVFVPIQVDLDPYGPAPTWAAGLPGGGVTWSAAIAATAARHGLDGRLLAALIWTESNFRPDAVSHAGALGLSQLMPDTARGLGVDPRDPLANLDGGARYLRRQLERFDRVDLALAAYNAGPGRVERARAVPDIVETQLYVVRVLERYEQLGG